MDTFVKAKHLNTVDFNVDQKKLCVVLNTVDFNVDQKKLCMVLNTVDFNVDQKKLCMAEAVFSFIMNQFSFKWKKYCYIVVLLNTIFLSI